MAPGKHNIAAIDAPQGMITVDQKKGFQFKDLLFIIRQNGKDSTLCRQKVLDIKKYITGKYDLEIPTLPVTYINNVEVRQSEITTITLPQPGVITILVNNEGICELFVEKNNDLEWIYTIDTKEKSIPLILLPGNYRIIYRPLYSKQSHYSITKKFRIESGKSSSLRVF
jgi:Ca-activated chloride channel family protein